MRLWWCPVKAANTALKPDARHGRALACPEAGVLITQGGIG